MIYVVHGRWVSILLTLMVIGGFNGFEGGGDAAAAQDLSGATILARVDENMASETKISRSRMIIQGRGGARTVESQSWIRGTEESFTEYLAPPRDRGT